MRKLFWKIGTTIDGFMENLLTVKNGIVSWTDASGQ